MLVLGRRKSEEVVIVLEDGREILIQLLPTPRMWGLARLGFTAPKEIQIHRREVWEAIRREKANERKEG